MEYISSVGTTGCTVQVSEDTVQILTSRDRTLVYQVPVQDVPQHLLEDMSELYDWMMEEHVSEISARLDEMGL